jgi:hypothetical protein
MARAAYSKSNRDCEWANNFGSTRALGSLFEAFGRRPGASGAPSRATGIRNGNSGQNQVTTIDVHCFVRFFCDPNLVFVVMLARSLKGQGMNVDRRFDHSKMDRTRI